MKEPSFRSFIADERQKLTHYVRSLLNESAEMDAEDVVHDVLVKLLEKADPTAPMEYLAAYVYRSLKNRVIDHVRTRKSLASLDDEPEQGGGKLIDLLADNDPDALEILQTREDKEKLFAALEDLGELEKQVIIAHAFEGVPFAELSNMWNVPINTLLSHKSRGMKKLVQILSVSQGGTL